MAMMLFSARTERRTVLTELNPLAKIYALIVLSLLANSGNPIFMLLSFSIIAISAFAVRLPLVQYLRGTPVLGVLILFIFATDLAITGNPGMATEDAAKFFFLIVLSSLFMDSTGPDDAAASIGRFFAPILGNKAWRFSSAVMLTLTMLAHIFTSSREMLDARLSRGGSFLRHPIANTREYTLSLLLRLFEDMRTMDLALRSRLYDEDAARMALPFRKRDAIMTLCLTILPVAEKLL